MPSSTCTTARTSSIPRLPATAWNGRSTRLLDRLIQEKKVRPTIVVGIWSTPKRLQEYVPSKAFNGLPGAYRDKVRALYGGDPLSDGYLKFLVRELKPAIDRRFNVKTGPRRHGHHGLLDGRADLALRDRRISSGLRRRRDDVDPLAAVIAPDNKPVSDEEYEVVSSAFERYLSPALPDPRTHKLYFDHGSETLDAVYARYQDRVDAVVAAAAISNGRNRLSLSFPGQKHNEISWASRVAVPLQFLLAPASTSQARHPK